MQKAVMVKMYQDVEELNKLFDEGYVVDSVDDNGVYVLNKENNIKKSDINTEMTAYVTLDTTEAQRSLYLLGKTVNQIKDDERVAKQPHVRIEFDDIRDVPKVWVDGERDYDYNNNHAVVILEKY
ncbi:hypothetical protein [Leuconostoc citreum]